MKIDQTARRYWPYPYFFIVTTIVFAGFIFSDRMLFGTDVIEAGLFFRGFYAEFVRTFHRVPLWDPYIYCGLPFVDAMHGDTFFPLAALQFIMPIYKALGYKLIVIVPFAGAFTYLYLRKMKLSLWASVFGATAYMLSGFLISLVYGGHDGRMYITSFLPFLLYAVELGFQGRRLISWWLFAVVFGLVILANHPQFAYFAMWCVGAYFILRLVFNFRESGKVSSLLVPSAGFVLAMVFGLALGLVQIWPAQDYVRKYSPRSGEGRGYEYASSWSLHAEEAFSQIVPGFAGSSIPDNSSLTSEYTYWGKNPFKINSEYAGMITLYLGLMGLLLYRDRYSYFFLGTAVFALLYALGDSGLIFRPIYYIVPFVNKFRAPSTIMFLFCFSMAFLGARAVDTIPKIKAGRSTGRVFRWLLIIACLYLLSGLIFAGAGSGIMRVYTSIFYSGIQPGQWNSLQANIPHITFGLIMGALLLGGLAITFRAAVKRKIAFGVAVSILIGLVMIDSWLMENRKFIEPVDYRPYYVKPEGISFLQSQPEPFRSFVLRGALPNQNSLAMFGLDQVAGYHGNQLRWYNQFLGEGLSNLTTNPAVLALANAKFLVSRQEVNSSLFSQVFASGNVRIYENKEAVPRGRIVRDYVVIPDPDSALAAVLQPGFDYAERVVLDREPVESIVPSDSVTGDTVAFLDSPPDEIKVMARLSRPGLLALQDNWYPHWKARDSKSNELAVYRCDFTFMAVELPAGEHVVEFKVRNPNYLVGKAISEISWLVVIVGMLAGLVYRSVRSRKTGAGASEASR
jgi:hypothetical protein